MKLNIIKLLIGLILISFAGIKSNLCEEGSVIFIKNSPTFKFIYDPPRGCYEPTENLTAREKEEYDNYNKIVMRHSYSRFLDKIAYLIILSANVLMVSGLVGLVVNKKTKEIKLLLLDYFMQFSLTLFLIGLYAIRPYHKILPVDWRLYILIYFFFSLLFDYLFRKELSKNLQKQQIQRDAKTT